MTVNRAEIRVTSRPGGGFVVRNVRTGAAASTWLDGDLWRVAFLDMSSSYQRCTIPHTSRAICEWPSIECSRGDTAWAHNRAQCHGWHTPRAIVAAAELTSTAPVSRRIRNRGRWAGS